MTIDQAIAELERIRDEVGGSACLKLSQGLSMDAPGDLDTLLRFHHNWEIVGFRWVVHADGQGATVLICDRPTSDAAESYRASVHRRECKRLRVIGCDRPPVDGGFIMDHIQE